MKKGKTRVHRFVRRTLANIPGSALKTLNTFTLGTSDSIKTGGLNANCYEGIKTFLFHSNSECFLVERKAHLQRERERERGGGEGGKERFPAELSNSRQFTGGRGWSRTDSNQFAEGCGAGYQLQVFRIRTTLCPVGVSRAGERLRVSSFCPSHHPPDCADHKQRARIEVAFLFQ